MGAMRWIYLGYNPVNDSKRITFPKGLRNQDEIGLELDDSIKIGFSKGFGHLLWNDKQDTSEFTGIIDGDFIQLELKSYSIQSEWYVNLPTSIFPDDGVSASEELNIGQTYHFITSPELSESGAWYLLTTKEVESNISRTDWIEEEGSLHRLKDAVEDGELDPSIHPWDIYVKYGAELSNPVQEHNTEKDLNQSSQGLETRLGINSSVNIYDGYNQIGIRVGEILESKSVDQVHLLDYSTRFAEGVLDKFEGTEIDVYVLMKNPHTAIDATQFAQIEAGVKERLEYYYNHNTNLNVRFYNLDGVVRGRRIGSDNLFVSWYTREPKIESEKGETFLSSLVPTQSQRIYGYKHPIMEFSRGNPGFKVVDRWFQEDVFSTLWKSAITPFELYEREQSVEAEFENRGKIGLENTTFSELGNSQLAGHTIGDLEGGIDRDEYKLPIFDWINDASGNPEDRIDFLESISDNGQDTESLFSQ